MRGCCKRSALSYHGGADKVVVEARIADQDGPGKNAQPYSQACKRREQEAGHDEALVAVDNLDIAHVPHRLYHSRREASTAGDDGARGEAGV